MKNISFTEIATAVLILGLSVIIIYLVDDNRKLRSIIESPNRSSETLKENDPVRMAIVRKVTSDSLEVKILNRKRKTIIFVFSTTCPSCRRSIKYWNFIADSARYHGYDVFAVSVHDRLKTIEYSKSNPSDFPVYYANDSSFRSAFKISTVPQTILISNDMLVKNIWIGLIDSLKMEEIARSLYQN